MTQPKFAPIPLEDEVRPGYRLGVPAPWLPARPGELLEVRPRRGTETPAASRGRGSPGPDAGYAMRLAERLAGSVVLAKGEHLDDVLAGAVALAMRRAAVFGRAPVRADLEVALGLFGFLGEAPAEVVARRRALFAGVDHDEWALRSLVDAVEEAELRRTPTQAAASAGDAGAGH